MQQLLTVGSEFVSQKAAQVLASQRMPRPVRAVHMTVRRADTEWLHFLLWAPPACSSSRNVSSGISGPFKLHSVSLQHFTYKNGGGLSIKNGLLVSGGNSITGQNVVHCFETMKKRGSISNRKEKKRRK